MTNFSFNQTMEQAKKNYGLGSGEYFKVKDGDNRLRILSPAIPHQSEYKGKKTVKFVAWVIDRRDGTVKPYFMPTKIVKELASLQDDPEWAFDTLPMPYDINIKASNAGTLEVEYSVIASPKQTPLTTEESNAFLERTPIAEFVQKLSEKENQNPSNDSGQTNESNNGDINVEDIPF